MSRRATAIIPSCALIVLFLIPTQTWAEVIYHTGFTKGLPTGWSVIDGGQDGVTWIMEDPGHRSFPDGTAPFMVVAGRVLMDEWLVTRWIDCSSYQDVVLRFQNCFIPESTIVADVDVRVGTDSWQNVRRFTGSEAVGPVEVNLAPIADNQRDIQIRWRYHAGTSGSWWWGYWAIDDVAVRGMYVSREAKNLAWDPSPPDGSFAVEIDNDLRWTPAPTTVEHRVTLSTDFGAVNDPNASVTVTDPHFDPGTLDFYTAYFWRVDEFDGSQWHKGAVWSFTTVDDRVVIDDFERYTNYLPDRVFMTWMDGWAAVIEEWGFLSGNGTGASVGHDIWSQESPYYNQTLMETTIRRSGHQSMPLYYDNAGSFERLCYSQIEAVFGPRGSYWDTEPIKAPQNWVRRGMKTLSLWFCGGVNNWPEQLYLGLEDGEKRFKLVNHPGGPEAVLVPEWRQWCIDLEEFTTAGVDLDQVRRIVIGLGDPNHPTPGGTGLLFIDDIELLSKPAKPDANDLARNPNPPDGSFAVEVDSDLTWTPAPKAVGHRVTLSMDFDTANASEGGTVLTDPHFDPDTLEFYATYFWRVDEFDGSQWHKGAVWSFTTVDDRIVIDDFERYTNFSPDRAFQTWMDGWGASPDPGATVLLPGNRTGALVGYDPLAGAIMERKIVHSGLQSLPLSYDNAKSYPGQLGYSQIEALIGPWERPCMSEPLIVPQNWAQRGMKSLSLWLYGKTSNTPEQLYLGLEDGDKRLKLVSHPAGPDAVRVAQWKQWCIDLEEFTTAGLDLDQVRRIVIGLGDPNHPTPGGTGLLFIDDIELRSQVCLPGTSSGPAD